MPMYRMYIEGKDNIPTVRIDYQANYEGEKIRFKFGNEKESYYTYFNSASTYSNPADLNVEKPVSIIKSGPIARTIDFNISDNNLTLLEENRFKILNEDGSIGGDGLTTYDSSKGDKVLIYHYARNRWSIFNSDNVNTGSNSFDIFEPGKGYWIKATSQRAHNDGNRTKMGLIVNAESDLLDSSFYGNLDNGWNMLSFPDTDLRYATSGVFIPLAEMNSTGVNIFFGKYGTVGRRPATIDGNISYRDTNITLGRWEINSSNATTTWVSNANNAGDAAQFINASLKLKQLFYGEPIDLRAFPAMLKEANGSQGVVIIGKSTFETNASNATTLTGDSLNPTVDGYQASVYGEYILAFDINYLDGSDINGSIDFFIPSFSEKKFRATGASVHDLNHTRAENHIMARNIYKAMETAATPIGLSTPSTRTNVFLIDLDFETDAAIKDYSRPEDFRSILVAAGARFSIRDETYTKIYKVENNGTFLISGAHAEKVTSGNGLNIIDTINAKKSTTQVIAKSLGPDYFAITSSTTRNLDLLEDDKKTLFRDIALQDLKIPSHTKRFTKGAITKVYTHVSLLAPPIYVNTDDFTGSQDRLPITDVNFTDLNVSNKLGTYQLTNGFPPALKDLRANSYWAVDFPSNGIIDKLATQGKEMTTVATMNFSGDNDVYWSFIDLTKKPDSWYSLFGTDIQDIFHIYNQKAYWVNIKDKVEISESIRKVDTLNSIYQRKIYTHFNNTLIEDIGETTNHIDHTLNISFNKSFINPIENPYYDIIAIIAGEEYRLRYNGSGFQIRINSSEISLTEKKSSQAYDPIIIKAYDGLGNNYIENPFNNTYDIEYFKPDTPTFEWNEEGEVIVKVNSASKIEFYRNYISDISIEREKNILSKRTLSENKSELGWNATKRAGEVKHLRLVAKQSTTNNQHFYSNMRGMLYAPLKFGHVLAIDANPKKPKQALVPYSFIQKQYLTQPDRQGNFPKYNGLNGIDNGVQLTLLKKAIDDLKGIKMVYYPVNREGSKRINGFGGQYTMYLKVNTQNNPSSRPIAQITYIPAYAGQRFYVYYNKRLYQGVFEDSNKYNSDTSSYNLHSGDIAISFDKKGPEGNLIGTAADFSANYQPIIIPGTQIEEPTVSGETPNTPAVGSPNLPGGNGGNNPATPGNLPTPGGGTNPTPPAGGGAVPLLP